MGRKLRTALADLSWATAASLGWLLIVPAGRALQRHRTAATALWHLGRAMALLAFAWLVLFALGALGGQWLLLPILPAGYGLVKLIGQAVAR